jgi:pyruvate dehydrogenase E2 component (dihydrolipoamide acetyltransferase)
LGENPFLDIPLTNMRKTIASRLLESKQTIPHYYMTASVEVDGLLKFREDLNEVAKTRLSVNDFLIKAIGLACKDVPETNSHWMGDSIRQFENVDVSMAVATENGLITPIVKNADSASLGKIAEST